MNYLFVVMAFLVGLVIGHFVRICKYDGVFKIDKTDEFRDVYSMDFNVDLNDIPKKKSVLFKVEVTGSH